MPKNLIKIKQPTIIEENKNKTVQFLEQKVQKDTMLLIL